MKRFFLCFLSLMMLSVDASIAKMQDDGTQWILPLGSNEGWNMKYIMCNYGDDATSNDTNGNSWKDLNYDDSSWQTLAGPIGSEGNGYINQNFTFDGDERAFFLRRTFNLDKIPTEDAWFKLLEDDAVQVYLNGNLIVQVDEYMTEWRSFSIPSNAFVKGKNQLSIYYYTENHPDYLDYGIYVGTEAMPSTYTDNQGIIYKLNSAKKAYTVTGHTENFNLDLTIPNQLFGLPVTTIGDDALGWSELQSVVLPEGIETIGVNAISDCQISSLHIPSTVNSLYPYDDNTFSCNKRLTSITVATGNTVYDSRNNCNAIIETSTNRLVSGCNNTIIPNTVTSIGNDAFYGCLFSTITLPSGITSIGSIAFADCSKLKTIYALMKTPATLDGIAFESYHYNNATLYVPNGCKTAYQQASVWSYFQNIVEMDDDVPMGDDIIMIDDSTFSALSFEGVRMVFKILDPVAKTVQVGNDTVSIDRSTAGTVTIPTFVNGYTVVGIGRSGFHSCAELTTVWLPDSLRFIGDYAFYGCSKLRTIQIPEAVYGISVNAFVGCSELTNVSCPYIPGVNLGIVFPNANVEIIGHKASDEDYDVVIPRLVTNIGQRTFSSCPSIRTMRVEEGNSVYDSRDNCNAIILTAENKLLYGCKNTSIPETVTTIEAYAFEGHSRLSTITIPASVTSIGNGAFAVCSGIESVCTRITNPFAINDNVFDEITYNTATLYVPIGTRQLYQQTKGWKNFLNIVEREDTYSIVAYKKDGSQTNYSGIGSFFVPDDAVAVNIKGNTTNIRVTPNNNPNTLYYIDSNESAPSGIINNVVVGDEAENILLTEGYDFYVPLMFTANNISYSMIPTKGCGRGTSHGWETIILPFDVKKVTTNDGEIDWFHSISDTGKNFWLKSFSDTYMEDLEHLIFEDVQDFKANTPYILTVPDSYWGKMWDLVGKQMVFHGSNALLKPNVNMSIERGVYKITGTTTSMKVNNVMVMNEEGTNFVEMEETNIKPFHAYIIKRTNIEFADAEVKRICVENWDTNGDGELSFGEAAAVKEIDLEFYNSDIVSFDELQYFIGLKRIGGEHKVKESENSYVTYWKGFSSCRKLSSIILPLSLEKVDTGAFANCNKLKSISFPANVTTIGTSAFFYAGLENLFIPNTITSINGNPFLGCALNKIIVEEENQNFDTRENCNALIEKKSNTLIVAGIKSFVPSTIEKIEWGACNRMEIDSLVIPKSVKEIQNYGFSSYYFKTVTALWKEPINITNNVFSNYNRTLYVPYGCKAAYEAADFWKEFKEIIEMDGENSFYAHELTIRPGAQKTITLQLDNENTFIAGEFRLQLPAGLSIETDEDGDPVANIVSGRSNKHTLIVTDESNGLYHFMFYSGQNRAILGNSGDFITLSVIADEELEEGSYIAEMKNVIFSTEDEKQINLPDNTFNINVLDYTQADVNGDGSLNVMDVVKLVNFIMGRNPSDFVFAASDMDENGKINVMDLVNVVEVIMAAPQYVPINHSSISKLNSLKLNRTAKNTISLNVPDADKHIAAQFIVTLSGKSVIKDALSDAAHKSEITRMADGRYKVMVYSGKNDVFRNDSPISLLLSDDSDVMIEDVVFVDTTEEPTIYESAKTNTTGIMSIVSEFSQPTDIYTVSGKLMKKNATSTVGLAKGIYVVNNEKVIIK